jgi:hypothetical protein
LATLVPVVILVIAFALAGDRLAAADVGGVALRDIVIAIAVIVPFLSQTLARVWLDTDLLGGCRPGEPLSS